jgi:hypothetical protein
MMTGTGRRRRSSSGVMRFALLTVLLLGSLVGFVFRPGVAAQEIQATPLTDDAMSLAATSALTMTINTGRVDFGRLLTGETIPIESAVVVTVGGASGGAWQLSCSAAPTAGHTTDLPVAALEFVQASASSDWVPFQTSTVPCAAAITGDAIVRFNYRIHVPFSAAPGQFEVVVTYSVSMIE